METEIYEKCQNLIKNNIKQSLNEKTTDILTAATLALMLKNPERTLQKLPSIFQELTIFADNRSVLEICHEELGNYQEDEFVKHGKAAVTRALSYDEETGAIQEQRNLLLSLQEFNAYILIEKTIHELTHLMRYKEIEQTKGIIKIRNGININKFNPATNTLKRKHFHLEDGIVERYAKEAAKELYDFLMNNPELTRKYPLLKRYIKNFPLMEEVNHYTISETILNNLCADRYFRQTLDASFEEDITPPSVITYYNNVLNSATAFGRLSKNIDKLATSTEESELRTAIQEVQLDTAIFLSKSKRY